MGAREQAQSSEPRGAHRSGSELRLPDDTLFAPEAEDGTVRLWEVVSRRELVRLERSQCAFNTARAATGHLTQSMLARTNFTHDPVTLAAKASSPSRARFIFDRALLPGVGCARQGLTLGNEQTCDPWRGHGPVRRAIQRQEANPLGLMVVQSEIAEPDWVELSLADGALSFESAKVTSRANQGTGKVHA